MDDIFTRIQEVDLKDTAFLVIYYKSGASFGELQGAQETLSAMLTGAWEGRVLLVMDKIDLATISESMMAEAGWVRKQGGGE